MAVTDGIPRMQPGKGGQYGTHGMEGPHQARM